MATKKSKKICEFGDFQTPDELALLATKVIKSIRFKPNSVLEPTCGKGSFLLASVNNFRKVKNFIGVEINKEHLRHLKKRALSEYPETPIKTLNADFFTLDWSKVLKDLSEPILVIGNPPWVTSSKLGSLNSSNLPKKSNFQSRSGLEAITGKSNFDISEWMLLKYLDWFQGQKGIMAILCKSAVARKVLIYAWKNGYSIHSARIYKIDAFKYFEASVDVCFLVIQHGKETNVKDCKIYKSLESLKPNNTIGYHDGFIASNSALYNKLRYLGGTNKVYIWRSGFKHDCSKVMELHQTENGFINGFGENVQLEGKYLFPLFKSSDIGNGEVRRRSKFILVTQQSVGEDTEHISKDAPKTWEYLNEYSDILGKRASSIYRKRPRFSIFGVGDYTFAPWKVAISGFYKSLIFKIVGSTENRPSIFDDTVYFLSAMSKGEANFLAKILNSQPAQEFYSSMIFWEDKRPITIDILKRLDLEKLTGKLGLKNEYDSHLKLRAEQLYKKGDQKNLFL